MAPAASETGEAQNEEFITILSREIFNNERDTFMLKVVLVKGQPQINIQKITITSKLESGYLEKGLYFLCKMLGSVFQQ